MTDIIEHIMKMCGFPDDSTMVDYIKQEGWTELTDVVMLSSSNVNNFVRVDEHGNYKARPMTSHIRKLKGFLLYYNRKCRVLSLSLDNHGLESTSVHQLL
jgi:hypothetical protein